MRVGASWCTVDYSSRVLVALGVALTLSVAFVVFGLTTEIVTAGAAIQDTDTDGDTMPDLWEEFFGFNPNDPADASGDPDNDGVTNAQEYAARRHPVSRHARYFAEGSTGYFDTSVAVVNLSSTDPAHVALALQTESGVTISHRFTLDPQRRQTVSIDDVLGPTGAVSIIVESDVPVAADRSMQWGSTGIGSTLDSGSAAPATTWYFAEGATGSFLLYYLFENPGAALANVTIRYLPEGGAPLQQSLTLPARSRTSVFVNDRDPSLAWAAVGATIVSDVPILAERSMYLTHQGGLGGGASSSGSDHLSTSWYFGEGATGPFFQAFLTLLNPLNTAATATVTYHMSNGSIASKAYDVAANARRTVYVNGEAAIDPALSALAIGPVWFSVSSTQPIAAERAMWWSAWPWYEGHAAAGNPAASVSWAIAEGRHQPGGLEQTYALIGNTSAVAGQVRITLIPDSGTVSTRDVPIGASRRLTVDVGALFDLPDTRFSLLVDGLGTPGLPLVVDYARYRSINGVPFSSGGAAPAIPVTTTPTDTAPSVVSTLPASGATGVNPNTELTVTFNESVLQASAVSLQCPSGTSIPLALTTSMAGTTFTFVPTAAVPPQTTCVLTVAASAVTDVDTIDPPENMAENFVATFTTAAESAPTVASTTPAANATSVAPGASLQIGFSEAVTPAGNWFQIVCTTSGTRTLADTLTTGTLSQYLINPNVDFTPGETCNVTIIGAQVADQDSIDPPDTMASNHTFSFTVDVAPTVTSVTPANGSTGVATTTNISVTFSEPVTAGGPWYQLVCATSGTRNVADAPFIGGGTPNSFIINPNIDFAPGELCTVTIFATGVSDQDAGDPPDTLATDFVFSFTTDTPPGVSATTPANGSTTVTTTSDLTVTFTEPVSVTGNWFQIACATSGTRSVTDTAVSGGPTTFTINPNANFAAGESCTATIGAGAVSDQDAGDPPDTLTANYVFSFTVDAQPSVTSTTPANAATTTASTNLTVTFSEAVNVTGNWFQVVCGTSGTRNVSDTAVSGGPTTFTINPNANFSVGEACTTTVFAAQVTDQDGSDPPDNPAASHAFTFTIDAAPSMSSTTPANGSTVAATTNLTLTFGEAVDVTGNWFQIACASSGTRNVAATGVSGGPTTFTVNPNVDFTAGELCTVTVFAAQVTDQDAVDPPDSMAADFVFSFTVDAAPSVTATTPTNGAAQIATNANVSLTFSEAVNVTANWFQIACGTSGTRNVSDTAVSGGPTTFSINPNADFASGETCTVTVFAAQVADQDAADPPDNPTANVVFSFTIDAAPSVTSTTPTNGAIGVLPTTTIVVNFNESVNATASSFTVQCPSGSGNLAYTLSASPATSFTLTPTTALPEGVICTVTVLAAQISDADAGDPPDNMLANHVFSFSIPPNAVNDTRSATGNVSINTTGSSFSVLANDIGPGIAITAADSASARGGVVSVNTSTGTFTYNPPVGYEGTDTFNYTITNVAGSDIGTVTVTVSGMLWFIDDSAAACTTIAAGCGRLATPFSTLAAFNTVDGGTTMNGTDVVDPEAGDHVFIYSGSYAGGLTVEGQQRIIGEGAGSTLQTLSGITPATDSATLPSTGGTKPTITTAGFVLAANNQVHGIAFSGTSGVAIAGSVNVGTLTISDVTITNTTGGGISLTGGGTVTATGVNDITTTTGTALNVVNTTIAAANMTFRSISANGAASGVILNNTGASGSLIVTGNGTATVGGDNSGGIIQNTTGSGIRLTSTLGPSFRNMRIANTTGSGVRGTLVTSFTFRNGTIDQSNNDGAGTVDESNIAFNDTAAGTENNVSGVVTITDNVLTNALYHGVDFFNYSGTLSSVTITGNTITSATSPASSLGSGIRLIAFGSATTVASVTNATLGTNIITNFPSGAGIVAQGGNANAAGAAGTFGTAGNGSQIIAITGNRIAGQAGGIGQGMGANAIQASVNGKGTGNFNISNNGTVGNPITNIEGNVISHSSLGIATVTSTISNNVIVANHQADFGGPLGISVGAGETSGIGDTATLSTTISGNSISNTDANGILAAVREGSTSMTARILNNTVAAPLAGFRPGIRIDSGLTTATNTTVCLEISGNTSAGSGDASNTAPGIGLRKEGTVSTTHVFGVESLSPSPTGTPNVENHINSLNPGSATGINFGVGGTALLSATSGFTSCTAP